jgi:PTS system nitrogen regulatory IIA component
MQLEDILSESRCVSNLEGVSKKRLLATVSEILSKENPQLDADDIFNALMAREKLGSTGLGNGIAIPHCRVPLCTGIIGMLITLKEGIDFDAIDNEPVDLVFVLIVPEQQHDEHVKTLGQVAGLFSDEDFCFTLRSTSDAEDLYNIAVMY